MPEQVLVTGASGFVGERFMEYNAEKYSLNSISLRKMKVEEVDFTKVNAIVHLAGMAHQMQKIDDQIYFDVNFHLTAHFAKAAKEAGVKHFIFISTVKVYGDEPKSGYLDLNSPTLPTDPYGKSKLQAEEALRQMEDDNFTVSIIRPPLVYGPKVKGNMIRFLNLAQKNLPIPFRGIENQRSMVFLDNLVELINKVIDTKTSGVFIAGDKKPISTSDLLGGMYEGLGIQPRWFKIPSVGVSLLNALKPELVKRLFGSFVIDNQETNKILDFAPPYSSKEGIKSMTNWFVNQQ